MLFDNNLVLHHCYWLVFKNSLSAIHARRFRHQRKNRPDVHRGGFKFQKNFRKLLSDPTFYKSIKTKNLANTLLEQQKKGRERSQKNQER